MRKVFCAVLIALSLAPLQENLMTRMKCISISEKMAASMLRYKKD